MLVSSINSGLSMNPMERILRRIESTSIELGCHIGEFQSLVQTPAGQAMLAQLAERYTQATPSEGPVDETDFNGSQEN